MSTYIKDLGETELISLASQVKRYSAKRLLKGIGDDCAVIRGVGNSALLVTTDVMIEGVHFIYKLCPPESIGAKLLSINLSDIAAMGGRAENAFLCMMLPETLEVSWVQRFFKGFEEIAKRYEINLAGGDISRHPDRITLSLTLIGKMRKDEVIYRSRAREGDIIFVSGTLGDAGAGLQLIREINGDSSKTQYKSLINKYLCPEPRLELGRLLSRTKVATSMIDLSDGFSVGLKQLTKASRLTAVIEGEKIPLSDDFKRFCDERGLSALKYALAAGEDYELLFTVKPDCVRRVERFHIRHPELPPLTRLGFMKQRSASDIEAGEYTSYIESGGWDHFKR